MKAIVIENDYIMPYRLNEFLERNPDLFSEVRLEVGCDKRPLTDLLPFLTTFDVVLIDSTFMNTYQVEELVDALYAGALSPTLKFYIMGAEDYINSWLTKEKSSFEDRFAEKLLDVLSKFEVYSMDWLEGDQPVTQIIYSEEHNVFHRVGQDPLTAKARI